LGQREGRSGQDAGVQAGKFGLDSSDQSEEFLFFGHGLFLRTAWLCCSNGQ